MKFFGRNNISLDRSKDPIKKNIIQLKNSYNMTGGRSPKDSVSSGFNQSTTSSYAGDKSPYWDLLSLNDVREHEKEVEKKKEAKRRAQNHLKACLEGQMREKNVKDNISKFDLRSSKNELLLDKMKLLERGHLQKANMHLRSIDRDMKKIEDKRDADKYLLQSSMRIPQTHSSHDFSKSKSMVRESQEHNPMMSLDFRRRQKNFKDSLDHIIHSRKEANKEHEHIIKRQDLENMRYENDVLLKLEHDQKNNMLTKVKNPLQNLDHSYNPNLSLASQQADKLHYDYVSQKILERQKKENEKYDRRDRERKERLMEIQKYQRYQMNDKIAAKHASKSKERLISKHIISKDLDEMNQFQNKQNMIRKQKTQMVKQLLDDQIQQDRVFKSNDELEEREFALNANKIRSIIDKY